MLRVLLFASLRDRAGWGERTLQLGSDAVSAAQLWSQLELGSMQGICVAVNQELVGADQLLKPGDELAFLPPFTGG
jgi:molybdopterin synthase sulfur carrier subunit